jgi:hypothetical protein
MVKKSLREWFPPQQSAWHTWRDLPAPDRRLVLQLVALLPAVAAAIRIFGLRRVCRFLSRHPVIGEGAGASDAQGAREAARLVNAIACRIPGRPNCLTRSVTLWWILRRRGTDSALRIGVRTADGRFEAHAWVELDGLVVNDDADIAHRFAPFEGTDLRGPRTIG